MTVDIADRIAEQVVNRAGVGLAPPVDLARVAEYLGVISIHQAALVEDGRLNQVAGSSRIYVRAGVAPSRRRFTIAHELGHIVLAGREKEFIAHRSAALTDPEERFCNQFAAALLLPRGWLVDTVGPAPESLRTAREVSRATGASLAASVVRLREVLAWRCSMLQWRRLDGSWRLVSTVGLPLRAHNRITSTDVTRDTIGSCPVRQIQRVALPLAIDGRVEWMRGELSVSQTSAVLLGRLGRAP